MHTARALQLATFASLQLCGNWYRHQAVDKFLHKCRDNKPGFIMLRRYAAITTDAFGQAYLYRHLSEVDEAKRMTQLVLRFDLGPCEGHMRWWDPRINRSVRVGYPVALALVGM